ncbi:IS3 family transposase [Pedobacter sp. ISL-68]|uniref:IS3 family transposase n=1 Tax=unclassified Pedobacter TaxID=2628915 RepID=UPI001BE9C553|nr:MULTISPECIES: IS3 family transposase [unclassified Pedobacter]MBT2561343.1 IS3 family transposase [Pedobacter sp. ISL-64]MBT2590732.1 IS3 family transposase [Pedobacter sp. ISL-68]
MKIDFSHIGLAKLCGWFGITRQAYYQNRWEGVSTSIEEELVLQEVISIRRSHPRMGARKLYDLLEGFMLEHSIKMGRDALFALLAANNLLVRKRKRGVYTTNSHHWLRKYPNLIRGFVPTSINQLWVSDITYWKVDKVNLYISFITDAYSRKIVGYQLAKTLAAIESVQALQMALSALGAEHHSQLVHHSDRGIQYCSHEYVKLLQDYGIRISMTENGDPLENAIAERLNGIMKDEYLHNYKVRTFKEAAVVLKRAVTLYNNERPHMSISNFTPNFLHLSGRQLDTGKLWRNYYQKQITFVNKEQD